MDDDRGSPGSPSPEPRSSRVIRAEVEEGRAVIESPVRTDRPDLRRAPWGLLGMLGLVVAIEWNLAAFDLDFMAPWHWDWRVMGRAATRPERVRDKDLLFFGDSLVKFGLMPRVIRQGTGRDAYNFALHSGQAPSSYFMLRRTIRAGAKPSAVVLDLTPHMLIRDPNENRVNWAELLSTEECFDLARAMGDGDFFARTMLERAFRSYKARREIRANVLGALRGYSTTKRYETPTYRRNWRLNDGAQLMGDSGSPGIDPVVWARNLYSRWAPDPVNVAYLARFLDLAGEHRIPVYWLLPPIHPGVQARTDLGRFDAEYTYFVRSMLARFPGTIAVDGRHAGFTADLFVDGAHLNRRGALKLSVAMAEALRRPVGEIGPDRWVALDLAGLRDYDGPIEDISQSFPAERAESLAAKRR